MYALVRTYSGPGAAKLFDILEDRKRDVEAAVSGVPGLTSYTLLRTADGGIAVTVCETQEGAEQSLKVAREWIQQNASAAGAMQPTVSQGSVILQLEPHHA